jgi:hypothetical protein
MIGARDGGVGGGKGSRQGTGGLRISVAIELIWSALAARGHGGTRRSMRSNHDRSA